MLSPRLALIASGREWAVRSLDSILTANGYAVLHSETGAGVIEKLRGAAPDFFLLDANLSDISGSEVCRLLRTEVGVPSTTPILILTTDPITRNFRLAALAAGAWECLGFPLDAEELLLKLQVFLAAKAEADALREISLLDQTTGFYSAGGLLRRVRELASEADRYGRPLGCVALAPEIESASRPGEPLDLPDTEATIRNLRLLLERSVRTSDTVGRLGGVDFVVLTPDTGPHGAQRLAERLTGAAVHPSADAPMRLRAGYYAVDNYQQAEVEPVDLLVRATLALRRSQTEREGDQIRVFEPPPPFS